MDLKEIIGREMGQQVMGVAFDNLLESETLEF